jgi:hypothetical protein
MKKKKLNIIDVVVIVAVFAIIVVGVVKFAFIDKKSGLGVKQAYKDLEYTVVINNIRSMTAEAFHVGDKVYDEKKGTYMGIIKNIEINPYKTNEIKNNGEFVEADKVGYYSVLLTMESTVVDKDSGYFLAGTLDLKINSEYEIVTKFLKTTVKVTDILTNK